MKDDRSTSSLARIRERLRRWVRQNRRPRSRLQARFDTSDILQESMVQVHQELEKGRTPSDLPDAWLKRVANGNESKLIERHRAQKRSVSRVEPVTDRLLDSAQTPDEQAQAKEDIAGIIFSIQSLPPKARQILHRRIVLSESFPEIARQMGLAEHQVRRAFHAAEDQIRKMMML